MIIANQVNYRKKIITLWIVFLLGTLFHTQLGLMPLFHGLDVIIENQKEQAQTIAEITPIFWAMLVFFILPLVAIIATTFYDFKRYRAFHFGLTIVYTVMNLIHAIADLLVSPIAWYQITLMVFLLFVGILLNIVSYRWMQNTARTPKLIKM